MNNRQWISVALFMAVFLVVIGFPPHSREVTEWHTGEDGKRTFKTYTDPLVFRPMSQDKLDSDEQLRSYRYERNDTAWHLLMLFVVITGATVTYALDVRYLKNESDI